MKNAPVVAQTLPRQSVHGLSHGVDFRGGVLLLAAAMVEQAHEAATNGDTDASEFISDWKAHFLQRRTIPLARTGATRYFEGME